MIRLAILILAVLASGCVKRPAHPPAQPHYVVGSGYELGGRWYYPREDFHYDETGLATVLPSTNGLTADGEAIDPTAMTAAHRTLQLPAIAVVTNLETGLQTRLRVNDRGPANPARFIGLSPRAATLLGVPAGGAAMVRVQVDEAASAALRDQMKGGPVLAVATAPRSAVTAETLAPPPGIGQSSRGRGAGGATAISAAPSATASAIPDRLPETVTQVPARPGLLMIEAGSFGQMSYARQMQTRLGGLPSQIRRIREGRVERYQLVAGPFPNVADADNALDQALRAGVTDARIMVE